MEPIEYNRDAFPLSREADSTFVESYFDRIGHIRHVDAEYILYTTIGADCWAFGTSPSYDSFNPNHDITMFYDSYSHATKSVGNENRKWVLQHPQEFLDSLKQSKSYLHIWMFYKNCPDGYKLVIDFTQNSFDIKDVVQVFKTT